MTPPYGLTPRDLEILRYYAEERNRELYWNYLAQLPGNDGYGVLALGVVRNDNMPGATANSYARNHAWEHDQRRFSEQEWDDFGVDLMRRDLAYRDRYMAAGDAQLALNLPVKKVQEAHDLSFMRMGIDADAWTPRKLLEASRVAGREEAERQRELARGLGEDLDAKSFEVIAEARAERLWSGMLDSKGMGMYRLGATSMGVAMAESLQATERAAYAYDMGKAYMAAADRNAHESPDRIGDTYHYFERIGEGQWRGVFHSPEDGVRHDRYHAVDAETTRRLEETRALRMHRARARNDFHPDDPGHLIPSPHPLAAAAPRSTLPGPGDDRIYASIREQLPKHVEDAKVAEMAVAVRRAGIRSEAQLGLVDCDEQKVTCALPNGRTVEVGLHTPSPPKEESLALADSLDQDAIALERVQMQQLAMQPKIQGPVLRL